MKKELIPHLSWRMFKVKLRNGRWLKLPQFRNFKTLYKHLEKINYSDVYYSKEYYRQPEVDEKDLEFINSDLVIDLDEKNILMVKKIIDFIKQELNIIPRYVLTTGRGAHIAYNPEVKDIPKDLINKEKERYINNKRRELVEKAKKMGLKWDFGPTINKSVIRLPNSIHKNQTVCRTINYDDLDTNLMLLSDEEKINSSNEPKGSNNLDFPPQAKVIEKRVQQQKPSSHHFKVISNKINRDSYIGHLIYNGKLKRVLLDLLRINLKYPLDCAYIRRLDKEEYDILIPKIYSGRRLEKIINYSHSDKSFLKFKNSFIRTSEVLDENNIIKEKPKLVYTLGEKKMNLPEKYENFIHWVLTGELKNPKPLILEIRKKITTS